MNISPTNSIINKLKPAGTFVVKKSYALAKRILPGMLMMTCSFAIGHRVSGGINNTPSVPTPKQIDANWAYKAGQQHIKDSLKIVELEQRIAADSMKIYHLTKKIGLDKVAKK